MSKVVKSYKGFNKDMTCRGFQYKEGKEYETSKAVVCNVCGEDILKCTHKKGEVYGSKFCCGELVNPYDAYEWSFVAPKVDENESDGGA